MADPEPWGKVANYLGVTDSTVRAYAASNRMPPPDTRYGVINLKKPATIRKWNASRPREGTSS